MGPHQGTKHKGRSAEKDQAQGRPGNSARRDQPTGTRNSAASSPTRPARQHPASKACSRVATTPFQTGVPWKAARLNPRSTQNQIPTSPRGRLRTHPGLLRPCLFKALTGFPCVTCGLTRCSLALLDGRLGEAFHWHPVAVLLLLASPLLVIWDLRRALRGEPYPPLPVRLAPRLAAVALLAGTWILQIARGL